MAHEPIKAFLWSPCKNTKAREEPLSPGNVGFGGEDTQCQLRAHFLY